MTGAPGDESAQRSRKTPALRLVEVGLSWPPETFLMLKLRSLARRGVEVRVGSFRNAIARAAAPAGVRMDPLPTLQAGVRGAAGALRDAARRDIRQMRAILVLGRRLPVRLWRLYLYLLSARPDIVHFEWPTVASTCLPLLEVWEGPIVLSFHGSEINPAAAMSMGVPPTALRSLFGRADAVHVVSQAKGEEVRDHGLDPAKSSLIRAGVDVEVFRPLPAAPARDRFVVANIGWLRWLKGHEYALLAIAELVRDGIPVELHIAGGDPAPDLSEPSQRARIVHTARDLGIEDRVHLHGHVPPAEVCALLQRSHALLHASFSEGLPVVVVEAMACGVPPVATDVGGTREAIRNGVDGFLIPPRDPAAAAAALRTLWNDPGLRARMGLAARARAEAEFTIDRQTDEWLELYERLARPPCER